MRKDSYTESKTYVAVMNALPNYEKLYFKIGKTINHKSRFRQLRTANPFIKTILLHNFDCEYYLHKCFKDYHLINEWFVMESKDIKDLAKVLTPFLTEFKNK